MGECDHENPREMNLTFIHVHAYTRIHTLTCLHTHGGIYIHTQAYACMSLSQPLHTHAHIYAHTWIHFIHPTWEKIGLQKK